MLHYIVANAVFWHIIIRHVIICYSIGSLQRNKNRTDDLQKCIEKRLELLNDTVTHLRNEVRGVVIPVC